MLVRTATLDDAEAIRAIYNIEVLESTVTFDLVPRTLAEQRAWQAARSGALTVVVAERDGMVVGFGALSAYRDRPGYRTSVEDSVYVDRSARGTGVGDALVARLVADARAHGFHAVFARIAGEHHASIGLHRKHGFRVVGTEREVGRKFGQWLDVVLMEHLVAGDRPHPVRSPDGHPVLTYLAAFADHAPTVRRDLLERSLSPDFRYCDPGVDPVVHGIGEMDQLIAARRNADPDLDVTPDGEPEVHHRVFRLAWRSTGRNGVATGTVTGEVDHSGRILRVEVFGGAPGVAGEPTPQD